MDNKDRHLCKTCIFKSSDWERKTNGYRCNYIEVVGHSRGCPPEDCDKYEKGRKKRTRTKH